jgi:hypothetical protein
MQLHGDILQQSLQEVSHELAEFRANHVQSTVYKFALMVAAEEMKKKSAKPKPKVVKSLTEVQRIFAEQPQTTSGEIGHHRVPVVDIRRPAPVENLRRADHENLQSTVPQLTSAEVGFHRSYRRAREGTLSEAQRLARSIDRKHVQEDQELRAGLNALRERVLSLKARQVH